MYKSLAVSILLISSPCFAQSSPKVMTVPVDLYWERQPVSLGNAFARLRVSEEGQAVVKAICAYYDIPPQVVDLSTEQIWRKQTGISDAGNEHWGKIVAPEGYEVCSVQRVGEISITGGSSLSYAVWR